MPKKTMTEAKLQEQINKLYMELDALVVDYLQKAELAGKSLLIAAADYHISHSKNKLIVQTILLDICQRRNIKNYFSEGNTQGRKQFEAYCDKEGSLFGDNTCLMLKIAREKKFKMIALEEETKGVIETLPFEPREKNMMKAFLKNSSHGVYIGGFMHLAPVCQSSALRDKFIVLPINGCLGIEQLKPAANDVQITGLTEKELIARLKFVTGPKDVIQKIIFDDAKITQSANTIVTLVKKAGDAFDERPENIVIQSEQTKVPGNSNVAMLLNNVNQNSLTAANSLATLAASSASNSNMQSLYPMETTNFSSLLQLGSFFAAKLGFCEIPSQPVFLQYHSAFMQQFANDYRREASVEQAFNNKGTSLEAALDHYYGKNYRQASIEVKLQLKAFIIAVINGDVDSQTEEAFNEAIKIDNDHLRWKTLIKLEKSCQESIANNLYMKTSFRL